MEELLAPIGDVLFDIETSLEDQTDSLSLPFSNMDKSAAAVCVAYLRGECLKGPNCPFRHIKGDRSIVCKHWLRGLCKKGDSCEFLHEFDASKMPECYFYSRFHACSNKECPFLHIDPESKIKNCPWYDRGFCRHGPNCRHRHTRRISCACYLAGFCPAGPNCRFVHPRFDLPILDPGNKKGIVKCHFCNETGHKIYNCTQMPPKAREEAINSKMNYLNQRPNQPNSNYNHNHSYNNHNNNTIPKEVSDEKGDKERKQRPLDQVTCFKCGERGHYANKCPKGHLAFLSASLSKLQGST